MSKTGTSFFIAIGLHVFLLIAYSQSVRTPLLIPHAAEAIKTIEVELKAKRAGGLHQLRPVDKKNVSSPKKMSRGQGLAQGQADGGGPQGPSGGAEEGKTKESVFQESIVNYEEPIYPRWAIKRGLAGRLRMRIKVSREGVPMDVELLESSKEASLDKSALDAAYRWRFKEHSSIYFVEKNIVFQLVN